MEADGWTRVLARLAVQVGANVAPGQDVLVLAFDVEHAPLARAIADEAYRAGAHYVSVLYWDQHVKRSRLLHAPEESLADTPSWWDRLLEDSLEKRSLQRRSSSGATPRPTCSRTSIRH